MLAYRSFSAARRLTALLFVTCICNSSTASAEPELLTFGDTLTASEPAVLTQRKVTINSAVITGPFTLTPPGHAAIHAKPTSTKTAESNSRFQTTTVTGKAFTAGSAVEGEYVISRTIAPDGSEGIYGTFRAANGKEFVLDQDNGLVFSEIDGAKQLDCGGSAHSVKHRALKALSVPSKEGPSTKSANIRVLIAYTPDAIETAKSEAALLSRISNMVANANLAHANSQTGVTLELAAYYALSERSNDNYLQELSEATDVVDGKWDELGTLREQYCADMVSVIVGGTNGGQICGIAWIGGSADTMGEYQDLMFSIVSAAGARSCSSLTFVHELGHNMGSDHDIENSSGGAPAYPYSYGWRFSGTSAELFRTVMAYSPGTRIPYFSSPNVAYDGQSTGANAEADNAASILATTPVVAGFLPEGGACLTGSPLPPPIPSNEPDAIEIAAITKAKKGRTKVTFELMATNNEAAIPGAPLKLLYDKKRAGAFGKTVKSLTTNSSGVAKHSTYLDKLKNGFYRACSFGSTQTICSDLVSKRSR